MPKTVISNTTPIITLLGVKQFDLLESIYQEIIIPKAVFEEMEAGKEKPYYTNLDKIDWIKIEEVQNKALVKHLSTFLDKGESEAIILAEEKQADLLLLDERQASNYAMLKNLKYTGSFGVLLNAKDLGLIENIKPLLLKAQDNGIRMSEKLMKQVLTEANEI